MVCACLLVATLLPMAYPSVDGGFLSKNHCARGQVGATENSLILNVGPTGLQTYIEIHLEDVLPIRTKTDISYCLMSDTARVGTSNVPVTIDSDRSYTMVGCPKASQRPP